MTTLDDLLVDVGQTLDRLSAAHVAAPRPRAARTRWVAVAAAAVVVAGTAAVVAVNRGGSPGSVKTTEPPVSAPQPSGADTTPVPTPPPPTAPVPGASIALDDIGPQGAPVVPAVLPDGYRLVTARYSSPNGGMPMATTTPRPESWVATYLDTSSAVEPAPYIQLEISPFGGGDIYAGFPWASDAAEVQIGPFVGKVGSVEEEHIMAVFRLDGDRRLLITGARTTLAAIQTVAGGLELRDDVGADATALPAGFELIDEGTPGSTAGSAEWSVGYAKDERMDSMFGVWTIVNPTRPAVLQLAMPMGRRLQIAGREVYTTPNGFVFDVSPSVQVKVEWGGRGATQLGADTLPPLEAVLASLVAIPADEFDRLEDEASARPLSPVDMDCGSYVNAVEQTSGGVMPARASAAAPGSVTFTATVGQPLLDVEFAIRGVDPNGMAIESDTVLRMPALAAGTREVTVGWDGTIGGTAAAPGTYDVTVRARPDVAAGARCTPPSPPVTDDSPGTPGIGRPGFISLGPQFVVS